mmetsp:Transcript_8651/g.15123  ORF Transcript_8651/g.15123 Transcript_8651/m.15123 type:complete len:209 (-) Transcript_8651:118-744(-)
MRFRTTSIGCIVFVFVDQKTGIDCSNSKSFRVRAPRNIDNAFAVGADNSYRQLVFFGKCGPEMAAIIVSSFVDWNRPYHDISRITSCCEMKAVRTEGDGIDSHIMPRKTQHVINLVQRTSLFLKDAVAASERRRVLPLLLSNWRGRWVCADLLLFKAHFPQVNSGSIASRHQDMRVVLRRGVSGNATFNHVNGKEGSVPALFVGLIVP